MGAAPVGFSLDFSAPASSYAGLTTTTTGTLMLFRSAATAVTSGGATDACYEDRGTGEGGGVTAMGSTTNEVANVFDLTAWTANGTGTVTTTGTRPDGGAAQKITRSVGSSGYNRYSFPATNAARVNVFVLQDVGADPPTSPGALLRQSLASTPYSQTFPTWTRYVQRFGTGATQNTIGISPAGGPNAAGSFTSGQHGSQLFGGASAVLGDNDVPIITSGPASVIQQLDAVHVAAVVSAAGALDFEVQFIPNTSNWNAGASGYLWSATTTDGLMSLRFDLSTYSLILAVRGVDVLTTGTPGNGNTRNTALFSDSNMIHRARAWYNPGTGACGIRVTVNGSTSVDATTTATGSALAKSTALWLGSNSGTTGYLPSRFARARRLPSLASVSPEIVEIGDSNIGATIASSVALCSTSSYVYTAAQALTHKGILVLARHGDTCAGQLTAWNASPAHTAAGVLAVSIQVGFNDVTAGTSTATITAALQALVSKVKADQPGATVYLWQMVPAIATLTGAQQTVFAAVQANIAGTGGTPITGADFICTECTAVAGAFTLNDGSGSIATAYDAGDGIHVNASGRQSKLAAARVARYTTAGILP